MQPPVEKLCSPVVNAAVSDLLASRIEKNKHLPGANKKPMAICAKADWIELLPLSIRLLQYANGFLMFLTAGE